jgi:IclR family KDG regulon transcriptional repressor
LDVLGVLEGGRGDLTLMQLSRHLDESPTVVFRLLKTLEEYGYVTRDRDSKRYNLGLRIWEVGRKAVGRLALTDQARPVLRWLTDVTGETSYLAVVRGTDTIYVDVVEGSEPLRVYAEPGFRVPLYLTASGKAILAFSGPDLLGDVVRAGMKRLTPTTITSARALRDRLGEIRRTGLSVNRGERRTDISAAAAPIFDRTGTCVAAIGISGPSSRFREERRARIADSVRKAAEEISTRQGHVPGQGAS